ncbi:MAG: hypothetical protein RL325_1711 [Planctomycetota bacterium]
MDRIRQILRIARRRIAVAAFAEALAGGFIGAAIVAALAVLAIKLVPGVDWSTPLFAALCAGALLVATAAVFAFRRRAGADSPDEAGLALRVDERLRLDERLTSALALERSTDAYARAAVADAVEKAGDPALPSRLRAAFPVRFPLHGVFGMLGLALAALAQVFVPAYQWPEEKTQAATAALEAPKAPEQALERVKEELANSKALPQDLRDSMLGLAENAEPKVGGEADAAEEERREAIKRMSELRQKLDDVRKSENALTNEALKRDLEDLKQGEGELGEFTEKLSKGDFSEAKQELSELANKMQSGEMTQAEKEAVRKSLENMAKSLEALAEKQQSMKDALEKAGLDSQLANNAEALQRAIDQAQNLSEQQREELKKAAAAAQKSQQALKKFASAAKDAAKKSAEKKQGQQGEKKQGQQGEKKQGQQGDKKQGEKQQGQQQKGDEGQKQQGQQNQQQGQQQQGDKQQQQGGECPNPGESGGGQNPGSQGQQAQEGQSGDQKQQGSEQGGAGESSDGGEGEQPLSEMEGMLSELEMTEQMLQEAEALSQMADQESQSLGEGMCKGGQCNNPGQGQSQGGMGQGQQRGMNAGRAQGGNTGKSKTPTGTKTEKVKSKNAGGDIIARQLIENPNPEVGESVLPRESTGGAADGGTGSAVGEEQVPARYSETHKRYFGTLEKKIRGEAGKASSQKK